MRFGDNIAKGMKVGMNSMPSDIQNTIQNTINTSKINMRSGTQQLATEIDKALETMPSFDIKAKLGKDLSVKDKKFSIEHKGMNINIDLTVIMEADALATEIIKTKKVVSTGKRIG